MKVIFSDKFGWFTIWVEEEQETFYMVRCRWGGLQEADLYDTKSKQQALDMAQSILKAFTNTLLAYTE